jgi:PIN domain nuclease of toxin-antitoxin system
VPEPRAYVTDTHPLLFHAAGGGSLGRRARACFDAAERREAIVYVPAAVLWETSLLVRVGRIRLARPLREFVDDLFSNPAFQPFDLDAGQVALADEARPSEDPFDGLICAAASALGLPLVTRDRSIEEWGRIRTIW